MSSPSHVEPKPASARPQWKLSGKAIFQTERDQSEGKGVTPKKESCQLCKRNKRTISREDSFKSRSDRHWQSEEEFHRVAIMLPLRVNDML